MPPTLRMLQSGTKTAPLMVRLDGVALSGNSPEERICAGPYLAMAGRRAGRAGVRAEKQQEQEGVRGYQVESRGNVSTVLTVQKH